MGYASHMMYSLFKVCFVVIGFASAIYTPGSYYRDIHPFRVEGNDSRMYLAFDESIRKIPDNKTLSSLGYSFLDLAVLTSEQFAKRKYAMREDIESFYLGSVINADEVHRVQKLKISTMQDMPQLVKNLTKLGNYFNPSVLPFMGKYLLANGCVYSYEIHFEWLTTSLEEPQITFSPLTDKYLGIGPGASALQNTKIVGGDARMVFLNEQRTRILLACTGWYHPIRMRLVELVVNETSGLLQADKEYRLNPLQHRAHMDHKNWSPFLYNGSVLFVESIEPLIVLKTHIEEESVYGALGQVGTTLVSDTRSIIHWPYGALRGGSPAKSIGKGRHLTFFHSRLTLPHNGRVSYYFGALVFSGDPPFRVLSVSRVPIMHKDFYEGPWDSIKFYDYVYYPMNFFFHSGEDQMLDECENECLRGPRGDITLSMGAQDGFGFVAKLNLFELLSSMVAVKEASEPRRRKQ